MNAPTRSADRRRPTIVLAVVAVIMVVGAGVGVIYALTSGSDDPPASTVPAGAVVLPQNPSLRLLPIDGVWSVENDGNVTMSSIEVRSGDAVLCELGTLAPDERAVCPAASGVGDLTAFGLGPQDQVVEVGAG